VIQQIKRRGVRVNPEVLWKVAKLLPHPLRFGQQVYVIKAQASAARALQGGEEPHEARFAGAVWTQQAEDAATEPKVDAPQSLCSVCVYQRKAFNDQHAA
jgi:hypothetical protein